MNPKLHSLLAEHLSRHGVSVTKPRLAVVDALNDQPPLSMAELTRRLTGQIDRATLYRTITTFERIGVIKRIAIGWKPKYELADIFAHHHHHLTCQQCGKIVSLADEAAERVIKSLASSSGFMITGHSLEIQGVCPECQDPAQA